MIRSSKVRFFALSASVAATVLVPGPAQASAIIDVPCGDVAALRAAIVTANTDSEPLNTINLAASCVYTITEAYSEDFVWGAEGLPPITHHIDLRGHGATIQRDPSFGDGTKFRILHVVDGTLAIFDLNIKNGRVFGDNRFGGGGILNESVVFINGATFEDNFVSAGGGGAIDNRGFFSVNDAFFINNWASSPTGFLQVGGAIWNREGAEMEIRWNKFTRNRAAVGGAIRNEGQVNILETAFDDNLGTRGAGAIHNLGTASIVRSYLASNEAWDAGAIENSEGATLAVENSTFRANEAILRGFDSSTLRDGGALLNAGILTATHVTFSGNRAASGAAIFNDDETGSATLVNSIVNSNDPDCAGTITDGGHNLVWPADASCPASFEFGDPKLAFVSRNGAAQAFNLSHRLGPGSAAVDLISLEDCVLGQDQRPFPRGGTGCDAGSYEDQAPTTPGAPAISAGTNPTNTGQFTLGWSSATDADVGDTLTQKLFHQDADDLAPSLVSSTGASHHTFGASAPEAEGTFTYFVEASDGNLTSTGAASPPIVVDKTAPAAPAASTDRAPDFTHTGGGDGWYRDTVTVTFADPGDPVLADGSPGSGIAFVTAPQTITTSGIHSVVGISADRAGNVSADGSLTVQVDAEDPVVAFTSCPGDVLLGDPATVAWTASDASSGLATESSGSIALDTSTVGEKFVTTPLALDNVGHTASATCNYRVTYDFKGFFAPIKNVPEFNDASAKRIIALSFSLAGDQGLNVIASDYPQSAPITCGSEDRLDQGAATETSPRGFTYAPTGDGRYTYFWKTLGEWSGTCRQFIMKLDDGTFHRANFQF